MDLFAFLILTLICLSSTLAKCPAKCTCNTTVSEFFNVLRIEHCDDLQQLPLDLITKDVHTLKLSSNNISVLSNIEAHVRIIPQLHTLFLSNNRISQLEVNALRVFNHLDFLDLSRNNISKIPDGLFETLFTLYHLDLSDNPNLILPENGLSTRELLILLIRHCNLEDIPPNFFDSMPHLRDLYLQDNRFRNLGSHLLRSFQKIIQVNLERNNITVLQPELLSLIKEHRMTIYLDGNPFRCDCVFRECTLEWHPYQDLQCVLPPESDNNNRRMSQKGFLNSLNCEVPKRKAIGEAQ